MKIRKPKATKPFGFRVFIGCVGRSPLDLYYGRIVTNKLRKGRFLGFNESDFVLLPSWADTLKSLYWVIRVEGRDVAKKRRYYRLVKREKIRLCELGIRQAQINAVCRYLCSFRGADRLRRVLTFHDAQMVFNFT